MSVVKIYTDGAAKGNPGPGGYGIVMKFGEYCKEFSAGYFHTTNNRMELLAVIRGIEALTTDKYPVEIYSDSKYVVESIEKGWVHGWRKKDFKGKKNKDLWLSFLALYPKFKIKMIWIKGHAGHPENERCDQLAVYASERPTLRDDFYEDLINNDTSEDNSLF